MAFRATLLATTVLAGISLSNGALAKSSSVAVIAATPKTGLPLVLPQGGQVTAGLAYLTVSGSSLTVGQSSQKAIIDWSSFSVGQGGTVTFNNGSGATLNRVLGTGVSYIDGELNATGSVYLINANGVIVGKTGVINVGGTFTASTLDTPDTAFMAGGPLDFSGTSKASVINLGKIGALGGDIALIAATVDNEGALTAANGAVGLIAGSKVLMKDQDNDGNGLFSVELGDSSTSVANGGLIAAAAAELRAQQGNVYALAGSTGGLISAMGTATQGGRIWLVSEAGTTTVAGTLEAQGPNGTPGQIETSGQMLNLGSAKVDAHGGTWLLDPTNLTIDATAAGTIDASLSAGTNVTEQTTAGGATGAGNQTSGAGDIIIAAPLSWIGTGTLTLDAYHSVAVNANVAVNGGGKVVIKTDDGGTGGDLTFAEGASLSFAASQTGQALTINNTAYTLEYTVGGLISAMNGGASGSYALAQSGEPTASYTAAAVTTFSGALEGLGHNINGLTITGSSNNAGLIGTLTSAGVARDVNLISGSVLGSSDVGDLVGYNSGSISNVMATGAVSGGGGVGGLVGSTKGPITNALATGTVTGGSFVGGLVGLLEPCGACFNTPGAVISNAMATGAVSGVDNVGGLLGFGGATGGTSSDSIISSLSTGAVSGSGANVGGLVGNMSGNTANSFWDTQTSGTSTGIGQFTGAPPAPTGLTTAALQSGSANSGLGSAFGGGASGLYPYLASFFPNGVQAISGTAYKDAGVTAVNGAITINLDAGGALAGTATAGADGYYYIALPAGTIANGTSLLVSAPTSGSTTAGALLTASTYAGGDTVQSGVNLYGGFLSEATNATTLSGAPSLASFQTAANTVAGSDTTAAATIGAITNPGYLAIGAFAIDRTYSGSRLLVTTPTGDALTVFSPITIAGGGSLGLLSGGTLTIGAPIIAEGAATVGLGYDSTNPNNLSFGLTSTGFTGSLTYTDTNGQPISFSAGGALSINGTSYGLLYRMQDVSNLDGATGAYALASTGLDASNGGAGYTAAVIGSFSGTLEGLGNIIKNLTITTSNDEIGLIGRLYSGGTVRDIGVIGGSVSGGNYVGDLVGKSSGVITNALATGTVSGRYVVGGLVGANNSGTISNAMATGAVTAGGYEVGGLVGANYSGTISNATATGAVTGQGDVGGLVGFTDQGAISNALATGAVTGAYAGGLVGFNGSGATISNALATGAVSGTNAGGLVGYNYHGTITNAFWDKQTSGQRGSSGGAGLTTAQLQSGSASALGAAFGGGTDGLYPYLTALFPNGVQAISGALYSGAAQTGVAATPVSVIGGGMALGLVSSGANGYYYLTLQPGTVTNGETLLAYAPTGASLFTGTGVTAQSGLNLYNGVVSASTTATTLSAAPTLAQAQTAALAADGGIAAAATAINGAAGLGIVTSGASFNLNQALTLGANSLIVQTTASSANITVSQPIAINGTGGIGLFATSAITVNAPIAINGGGQVGLAYNTAANIYGGLLFGASDSLTFASGQTGQALTINRQAYTLEYDVPSLISALGTQTGFRALAQSGAAGTYRGAAVNGFSGTLEGLGHSITGLTVIGSSNYAGLIGQLGVGGLVRDLNLVGGSISGAESTGGLVGVNFGAIKNVSENGSVSGTYAVGGLVGYNRQGTINNAQATGAVTGVKFVGGLTGFNAGSISTALATGPVTGSGSYVGGLVGYNASVGTISTAIATGAASSGGNYVGGLVGLNLNTISNAVATGAVSGGSNVGGLVGLNSSRSSMTDVLATGAVTGRGSYVGGLVGTNYGTVANSFWDTQTSGTSLGIGCGCAGGTGLTTAALQSGSAIGGLGAAFGGGTGGLYPYLKAFFPNGVQAITATAAAGAQVGLYAGGLKLGNGLVSAGANGYVYLAVPAGTFAASGDKVGADVILSGASAVTGALYTDTGAVTSSVLALGTINSGINAQSTGDATYSALQTDLGATFGSATLMSLNTALSTTPVSITAINGSGFTIDQAVSVGGGFTLQAPNGGLTLANTLTAGGAILLAANGGFTNTAGASALSPGGGAGFSVYSQTPGDVTGTLPTDASGGLAGTNWYNDAFNFTTGTFTTAVPGGNHFVYGYAASLTITADSQTKVYGAALPALTDSILGFVNGDTPAVLSGLTNTTTATAASHVAGGPYAISASGAAGDNYTINYAPGALTVTPAPLTITADNQTKLYGAALPTLTDSFNGLVNGDTTSSLIGLTTSTTATAASHVAGGPYAITASGAVDSDYAISYVGGALTVTPAPLTITADNQSKVYGAALPTLTDSVTGFVNGDTSASLATGPTLFTTARAASHVAGGPYAIKASGAVDSDYTISYVGGLLTVTPASLTIIANNQSNVYGASLPTLTDTILGLVNGDTALNLIDLSLSTTATSASHVAGGPYAIIASGASDSDYSITYTSGALTVTPAPLTITADSVFKLYGAALPTLTDSFNGLVNGDTPARLTGLTNTTPATAASHVAGGPYAITASGAVDSDYAISYVSGLLTVTPAPLTITADSVFKLYGAALPTLTDSFNGLVNGDTPARLTGLTNTTPATAASHVAGGPYAITASGAVDSDYAISYVSGLLTVTPAPLTITADSISKVYGAALPTLTDSFNGLVNGDTASSLKDLTITTTATAASHVAGGPYAITAFGVVDSDYAITYVAGSLTVTPASLTAQLFGTVEKTYDGTTLAALASGNYRLAGLLFGDSIGLNDPMSGVYADANAGTGKTVSVTGLSLMGLNASDYVLTSTSASAAVGVIDPKVLTASLIGTIDKTYDGTVLATLAAGNYSLAGLIAGDSVSLNDPSTGNYADANAGTGKTITVSGLSLNGAAAGNYVLATSTIFSGLGVIDPRSVTITADNLSKLFGQADPSFTYKITSGSFIGSDNASGALTRAPGEDAGGYAILQGSLSASANYRLTFVNGLLTITGGAPIISPVPVLGSIAEILPTPFEAPPPSPSPASGSDSTPTNCSKDCVNTPYPTNLNIGSSIRFAPAS